MLRDVRNLLEQDCAANLKAMVTFTDVEVTDDIRYAKIFYSVLGGESDKKETSIYLNKIRKQVQYHLGRLLNIKMVPEITFEFDPSIERGMRIEQLLNEISKKEENGPKKDI